MQNVVELSFEEIMFVAGAGDIPDCPSGTTLSSVELNGSGEITKVTCEATVTAGVLATGASLIDTVLSWF